MSRVGGNEGVTMQAWPRIFALSLVTFCMIYQQLTAGRRGHNGGGGGHTGRGGRHSGGGGRHHSAGGHSGRGGGMRTAPRNFSGARGGHTNKEAPSHTQSRTTRSSKTCMSKQDLHRGRHDRARARDCERGWGRSRNVFCGFGAGAWASNWYYSPWDCDYSPGYGLWYFRRPCVWYARPYSCWLYWDVTPDNSTPVLTIESENKSKLWFAVYKNDAGTLNQQEAPRQLTRKENKYLFTNRSNSDIIVIAGNKKVLAGTIGKEDQRSKKLYIVQSAALHQKKPIDRDTFASTKTKIKNATLEEQENSHSDDQLEHVKESLNLDELSQALS